MPGRAPGRGSPGRWVSGPYRTAAGRSAERQPHWRMWYTLIHVWPWFGGSSQPGACVVRPQHACHLPHREAPHRCPTRGGLPAPATCAAGRRLPPGIARCSFTSPERAFEVGTKGSGQEAARYGRLTYPTRRACPTRLPVSPCTLPRNDICQTLYKHEEHLCTFLKLWRAKAVVCQELPCVTTHAYGTRPAMCCDAKPDVTVFLYRSS